MHYFTAGFSKCAQKIYGEFEKLLEISRLHQPLFQSVM